MKFHRFSTVLLALAACGDTGPSSCATAADCAEGESCFGGVCTAPEDLPDLALDEVDPIRSPARGGDTVTLRGAGFTTDMTVTFGETAGEVATVSETGDEADVVAVAPNFLEAMGRVLERLTQAGVLEQLGPPESPRYRLAPQPLRRSP